MTMMRVQEVELHQRMNLERRPENSKSKHMGTTETEGRSLIHVHVLRERSFQPLHAMRMIAYEFDLCPRISLFPVHDMLVWSESKVTENARGDTGSERKKKKKTSPPQKCWGTNPVGGEVQLIPAHGVVDGAGNSKREVKGRKSESHFEDNAKRRKNSWECTYNVLHNK